MPNQPLRRGGRARFEGGVWGGLCLINPSQEYTFAPFARLLHARDLGARKINGFSSRPKGMELDMGCRTSLDQPHKIVPFVLLWSKQKKPLFERTLVTAAQLGVYGIPNAN